ncbi:DEAD/DEAH box helicase family protein [Lentilactobacillus hilgardii]|uniref:restriction endonuclease n=1 Tax=Lentilactobacillus hilgardii TaxID=1588 RepID=UPI0039EA44B3
MQLSYEKLPYQDQAVAAIIDTLSGHDDTMNSIEIEPNDLDDAVRVTLAENHQQYVGTEYLEPFPQFNIEMETGTGKTMVYLKTIMALHQRFGENKFIIVVPSRAIKAGVADSLEKLQDYLADVHHTDKYHTFVYNSKQISNLQAFAGSSFEIMLTTIQAFNSNKNVINQEYNEGFFGGQPIDQIREANPIVIIDEPQSVDAAVSGKGKQAIANLNPKIVLRYSATHKDKQYPLLYEFGPVQAYNAGMVKHIETLGTDVDTDGNIPSVELKAIEYKNGTLIAKVEAYKATNDDYDKKIVTLKNGDVLANKTKNSRYVALGEVKEINAGENYVTFENHDRIVVGDVTGENKIWLTSQMTALVKDHLDRELKLQSKGIKVLSLIFLDKVENYRIYDNGTARNGEYAQLFEQIYTGVLHSDPKYQVLNDYNVPVNEIHDGYFAKDKATKNKPEMLKDTKGDTAKDESAYSAIMADKEGLLTQYVPSKSETDTKAAKLRFIFSHSALKEGWDNPNVFQILTIAEPKNELTRRQKIGRGLRISVNQSGERVYGAHNVVTIYANESFESFASGLQNEYMAAGVLSNVIGNDYFAGLLIPHSEQTKLEIDDNQIENVIESDADDQERNQQIETVSLEESIIITKTLQELDFVRPNAKPDLKQIKALNDVTRQDELVEKLVAKGVDHAVSKKAVEKLTTDFKIPEPANRATRAEVRVTDRNNKYFNELWDKIAHKVNYHVVFDEQTLIDDIVNGDNSVVDINISPMTAVQKRARIHLNKSSVSGELRSESTNRLDWLKLPISDVTKQIADKVGLTRHAIIKIVQKAAKKDSEFINKIKMNPALFVRRAINNIQIHQRNLLNKSLVYVQTGELWSNDDLQPFEAPEKGLWQVPDRGFTKTLFDQIATQSGEENSFAESLVNEEKVKYFLKLPNWFKIPTPFGNYVPDWAIVAETNSVSRMYFVVDTKSTVEMGELANKERDRIHAGRRAYLNSEVRFEAPVKVIGDLKI